MQKSPAIFPRLCPAFLHLRTLVINQKNSVFTQKDPVAASYKGAYLGRAPCNRPEGSAGRYNRLLNDFMPQLHFLF